MKYELTQLSQLIQNDIRPEKLKEASPEQFKHWTELAREEKNRICERIVSVAFNLDDPRKLELYLHNHQAALINLANTVHAYSTGPEAADGLHEEMIAVYHQTGRVLEEILFFTKEQFERYFNQELLLPPAYRADEQRRMQTNIQAIRDRYDTYIEQPLLESIVAPLDQFVADGSKTTFRTLAYFRELITGLLEEVKLSREPFEMLTYLHTFLIVVDFNAPEYVDYAINALTGKLAPLDANAKLEMLHWDIKFVSQQSAKHKPGVSLYPTRQSFANQLINWINHEIQYLEAKTRLSAAEQSNAYKTKTTLSVGQLAYVHRLLVEEGIIEADNIKELMQHVSRSYITQKGTDISAESLYSKYYANTPANAEYIKDVFFDMINKISKEMAQKKANNK